MGETSRRGRSASSILAIVLLVALLLALPLRGLAHPIFERHSLDFSSRILTYEDVWTRQEIEALSALLNAMRDYDVEHIFAFVLKQGEALGLLMSKLAAVSKRAFIALASITGTLVDLPENLLVKAKDVLSVGNNASTIIAALNELYESGHIDGLDYLTLLGHIIHELKLVHVGIHLNENRTINNIRRAVDELYASIVRPPASIPEAEQKVMAPAALARLYRVPVYLLVTTLLALLAPLVTHLVVSLTSLLRARKLRTALGDYSLIELSFSFPEDVIYAYRIALNLLSKILPTYAWETHREYLDRVRAEIKNEVLVEILSILTNEYERVRYGKQRPYLSSEQLLALLRRLRVEVNSVSLS